ncbi:MAG: NADP-dependent oxidoreductase [Nocardia sp.]|nr:NADP-dependent oxidoreductase [Nocardia sp.]
MQRDVDAAMATAIVAAAYGGPEVLTPIEVEVPGPGPGEVTVQVRAAGVNPIDYKLYSGAFGADPAKLPIRLGLESSGVVTAVGPDAVGPGGPIQVGDEVIARGGGYATAVTVPAAGVLPKPAEVSWEVAAGLLAVGNTAVHLVVATGIGPGDTVLIHGAAGSVGSLAAQLAVARGARVIGTAAPARHERLRSYGVEPVEYGPGLADRVRALAPNGVDAAIDTVGTDEAVDVSLELVADRHRIATIAAFGRVPTTGIQGLGGGPGADPGTEIRGNAWRELLPLIASGKLELVITATYPLADAAAAHEFVIGGHAGGKVILLP